MEDREFRMTKKASPFLAKSGFSLCMKLTAYLLTLLHHYMYAYLIIQPNTELPRYIGYIEGFSPGQGRMYFSDNRGLAKLSSYNCKEVELTDSFPDDIIYAVNVPGKSRTEVNENEIVWSEDDKIKADFDGLYDNDKMLVKWRSCCESGN